MDDSNLPVFFSEWRRIRQTQPGIFEKLYDVVPAGEYSGGNFEHIGISGAKSSSYGRIWHPCNSGIAADLLLWMVSAPLEENTGGCYFYFHICPDR